MGSSNLGNQWTSLRKSRLTCVYNNTYLNDLEDIIRVDENTFVGLFSIKLFVFNYLFILFSFILKHFVFVVFFKGQTKIPFRSCANFKSNNWSTV